MNWVYFILATSALVLLSICATRLTQIYMRLKAVTHVPEVKARRAKPEQLAKPKRQRSPRKKADVVLPVQTMAQQNGTGAGALFPENL